jgi:hypothetical protein
MKNITYLNNLIQQPYVKTWASDSWSICHDISHEESLKAVRSLREKVKKM